MFNKRQTNLHLYGWLVLGAWHTSGWSSSSNVKSHNLYDQVIKHCKAIDSASQFWAEKSLRPPPFPYGLQKAWLNGFSQVSIFIHMEGSTPSQLFEKISYPWSIFISFHLNSLSVVGRRSSVGENKLTRPESEWKRWKACPTWRFESSVSAWKIVVVAQRKMGGRRWRV